MKRFSIGLFMAVVFFLAIDLAVLRALQDRGTGLNLLALITLPMINVLLMLGRARSGPGAISHRLFWLGFQVTGWLVVALVVACFLLFPETFLTPVLWYMSWMGPGPLSLLALATHYAFPVAVYTPLELMVAAAGGLLAQYRIRVFIQRRPSRVFQPANRRPVGKPS